MRSVYEDKLIHLLCTVSKSLCKDQQKNYENRGTIIKVITFIIYNKLFRRPSTKYAANPGQKIVCLPISPRWKTALHHGIELHVSSHLPTLLYWPQNPIVPSICTKKTRQISKRFISISFVCISRHTSQSFCSLYR